MPDRYLPHVAARVLACPLLIAPRQFEAILAILGPRIGLAGAPSAVFDDEDEAAPGDPAKSYELTDDGIAIVPIQGPLVRKSSWMTSLCGMTSYAQIQDQVGAAAVDPLVKGILLDIDSPGGEAAGCFDLSDAIYSMRGGKPIYAIANESMYSAAYAIGSAADKLFVGRTGGVGSIGVIAMHVDQSGADAQAGLKYTPIYAGDHKNDLSPHEPLNDSARATMQAEIDRLYGMFADTVARNRAISPQQVKDTEAGFFFGPAGVDLGLADMSGTFADAYSAIVSATRPIAAQKPQPIQFAVTSVAAISTGGTTIVADNNNAADLTPVATPPAAAAPQQAGPAIDMDALRKQAFAEAKTQAAEIVAACTIAGKPEAAQDFLEKGLSVGAVLKHLAAERLTVNSQAETTSAVTPGMSTAPTAASKQAPAAEASNIMIQTADYMRESAEARKAAGQFTGRRF